MKILPSAFQELNFATFLLIILILISSLIIFYENSNINLKKLLLIFKKSNNGDTQKQEKKIKIKKLKCNHCQKLKLISELKVCSNCKKSSTSNRSRLINNQNQEKFQEDHDQDELIGYFCDEICQKLNWNSHKLICGNWKNLNQFIPNQLPSGFNDRSQVEKALKKWCDFYKNLLIFVTIHGLDLIRNPINSTKMILMVSLKSLLNQKDKSQTQNQPALQNDDELDIIKTFSLDHLGSLDLQTFSKSNPGLNQAFDELNRIRANILQKGGMGAAMLIVGCGPIVQVIPVGLPSRDDLEKVPRQKDWKTQFETAIKAGVKWDSSRNQT
ncbi:hypothetical protein O181_017197 [Austropuccinia psidii MF-1]|uniref:MYND-type domain-containing protein n=1 Tax=Austropuccinia psidii MF-1 TaxID=1389203 RepID=A0A9Q3C755_9BASI|nr:hypothetical protein [Austropuccinia psidii MF-1]